MATPQQMHTRVQSHSGCSPSVRASGSDKKLQSRCHSPLQRESPTDSVRRAHTPALEPQQMVPKRGWVSARQPDADTQALLCPHLHTQPTHRCLGAQRTSGISAHHYQVCGSPNTHRNCHKHRITHSQTVTDTQLSPNCPTQSDAEIGGGQQMIQC